MQSTPDKSTQIRTTAMAATGTEDLVVTNIFVFKKLVEDKLIFDNSYLC